MYLKNVLTLESEQLTIFWLCSHKTCMLGQNICSRLFLNITKAKNSKISGLKFLQIKTLAILIKFLARIDLTVPLPLKNIFKVIKGPGLNF